jgi:hypothetical protein
MLFKLEKAVQRGNRSRDAVSWIGGTQPHELRLQRVPGYQGFQPGIYAENVHGKTAAQCSQSSIQKKIQMAKSVTQKELNLSNMQAYEDNPNTSNFDSPGPDVVVSNMDNEQVSSNKSNT